MEIVGVEVSKHMILGGKHLHFRCIQNWKFLFRFYRFHNLIFSKHPSDLDIYDKSNIKVNRCFFLILQNSWRVLYV